MVHWGKYYMNNLLRHILIIIQAGVSCKWTNDSQHFLLEHLDTICDSPSHIYHSALQFSPPSAWLQEYYGSELSQEVKVIRGLPDGWGICSRTVSLGSHILEFSYWDNTIAVASGHSDIIILDTVTGSQVTTLSGHTDEVNSVDFSSDGRALASGSDDKTVKLWDMQTGGAIKTFFGHTGLVRSVSISMDCATIVSGSFDKTIRIWDVQIGECCHVMQQSVRVYLVEFSPTNPQCFLSASGQRIQQWNINGYETGPTFNGYFANYSSDGALLISRHHKVATVQNPISGAVMAKFPVIEDNAECVCFSPDGRLVAVTTGTTVHVWNITGSEPYLVETFIGHTRNTQHLAFSSPSSLISASIDQSVKFWQIGAQSTDLVGTDLKSTSLTPATVRSITLQTQGGTFVTSDSDGIVRMWDIFTGHCKASFQTPAKGADKRDVQLINGKLILAWHNDKRIKTWDVEKEELLHTVDGPRDVEDIKISEDGPRVFSLGAEEIQAQSIETGNIVGKVQIEFLPYSIGTLTVNGSIAWVHYPNVESQVWDFGTPGSSPVQLPNIPLCIPHPSSTMLWDTGISCAKEIATEKVIFRLSKGYGKPIGVQWNGKYLVASFISGEVLVLEFNHLPPK